MVHLLLPVVGLTFTFTEDFERNHMEHKDNYYSRDAISASLLKSVIKQSAVHAEERMKPTEGTPATRLGTAFHASILEPENWSDLIAVSPACDRRTKVGKEVYADFLKTSANKTIITPDQDQLIAGMLQSARAHPEVLRLFEECYSIEFQTFFDIDGIDCKAMIDMCHENGTIVDVKTTQDASPESFKKASANWLYHLQLAWYANAMGIVGDDKNISEKKDFSKVNAYIIAVESSAPFAVAVYKFSTEALESGWKLCQRSFNVWKDYKLNLALGEGVYPYSDTVLDLHLPAWAE